MDLPLGSAPVPPFFKSTGETQTKFHFILCFSIIRDFIKGTVYSFREEIQAQNVNIYNINEVIIQS